MPDARTYCRASSVRWLGVIAPPSREMKSVVSFGSVKSRDRTLLWYLSIHAKRTLPDGHDPILRPLALSDEHRPPFDVDVVDRAVSRASLRRMPVE